MDDGHLFGKIFQAHFINVFPFQDDGAFIGIEILVINLNKVDLPQPLAPIKTVTFPAGMAKSRFFQDILFAVIGECQASGLHYRIFAILHKSSHSFESE